MIVNLNAFAECCETSLMNVTSLFRSLLFHLTPLTNFRYSFVRGIPSSMDGNYLTVIIDAAVVRWPVSRVW